MGLVETIPYLPTQQRKMEPANILVYNDAPWLTDPAILSNYKQVSSDISNDVAQKLGCASLRESESQGEEQSTTRDISVLTCPVASTIATRLGNFATDDTSNFSTIMQYLAFDLLEVADSLSCSSVHFLQDDNVYPSQSILLPALAPFQGPSLTVLFRNCKFDQEKAYNLHSLDPRTLRERRLKYGWGLNSIYTISPILFVLSHETFYIFDPSSGFLPQQQTATTSSRVLTGRATSYKLSQITSKFPDQFKPFSVFDYTKSKNNTIFRIPLTHIGKFVNGIPPHLSENGSPIEAIRKELREGLETSMVFLPDLEDVSWSTLAHESFTASLVYACSLYAKDNAA